MLLSCTKVDYLLLENILLNSHWVFLILKIFLILAIFSQYIYYDINSFLKF